MMGERFSRVLVRQPSEAYAGCLRPNGVSIDLTRARIQHQAYVKALKEAGVGVSTLTPLDLPDSVFIEDTAVAIGEQIVLTRPGAMTRRQEIMTVADFFEEEGRQVRWLRRGTLDGGDVLRIGGYVLIGVSERTDSEGARELAQIVEGASLSAFEVEVRDRVHLKSTCSTLDAVTILATKDTELPVIPGVRVLRVPDGESEAANCVAFNRTVILPTGYPATEALLREQGYTPNPVELGEFIKGGGGPTCLSVRY